MNLPKAITIAIDAMIKEKRKCAPQYHGYLVGISENAGQYNRYIELQQAIDILKELKEKK